MTLMRSDHCVLVLVDYQSRLMPAIHQSADVVARAHLVAQTANALDIPIIGTEQNPTGLGPNVETIKALCAHTVSKMHFGACADGLLDVVHTVRSECDDIVIAGCEAHVCLLQTAMGLLSAGKRVWVVENASGSRRATDHAAAMRRLSASGATIVTHEMVMFEWLRDCRHPEFKKVLQWIKAADQA